MSLRRRSVKPPRRPASFSTNLSPQSLHNIHFPSPTNIFFSSNESWILFTLTALANLTRFIRLSQPKAVVFDEFHFGNFLDNHMQRKFSFDIHPWLGKLTLALFAWLGGYRADGFNFEIREEYPNYNYLVLRYPSALFGSLCVPLMYLICREFGMRVSSSVLGASLPLFDHLLLIQSRLILIDAQLLFYLHLTLLCALRLWKLAEEPNQTTRYYSYLIATAVSAALAMSVKWTAAATPFLVAVVCAMGIWFLRRPTPLVDCILAAVIAVTVYLVPWWVHLRLSTTSTQMTVHLGDRFRSTLHGNDSFPYNATIDMSFVEKVYELHWRQFRANRKIKTRHLWESRWYEWPLNMRGIYYYVDKADSWTETHPSIRVVYLLQNPAMAIWVFASVTAFAILTPLVHRYRTMISEDHPILHTFNRGSFLLAGYLLNLLPYILVERCYFLYHYLPALTYGQLLTVFLVDSLPKVPRLTLTVLITFSVVASFIFWAPWTYCLPIDFEGVKRRQWMPGWN